MPIKRVRALILFYLKDIHVPTTYPFHTQNVLWRIKPVSGLRKTSVTICTYGD